MNKTVKFVLVVSIAVNVIWLIGAAAGYFAFGPPSRNATAQTGGGALSPEAAGEVAALLSMEDATALRDTLRALGLPDDVVREVVRARIMGRYLARLREIDDVARAAAAQRPYWRGSRLYTSLDFYTSEQQKQIRDIEHETAQQIGRVLGVDEESPSFSQLYHAYLPREKAERLVEMESDYFFLRRQVSQEMAGFRMPGDEAKLKLLDDEKKRDLYDMLAPDEKAAYDLRKSDTAWLLQRVFAGFDGTEEEYKTIYALQGALEEKHPLSALGMARDGGVNMREYILARREAQKEIEAQIKETLGDSRYAEYVRGQRRDYQTLQAAAQRFNLSADTVTLTYQAREDAADGAKRISDDKSLDDAGKKEAYAALAARTTGQIRATLGDEVGDAYINNALVWLKNLPKGGTVKIDSQGNVDVSQPKPKSP